MQHKHSHHHSRLHSRAEGQQIEIPGVPVPVIPSTTLPEGSRVELVPRAKCTSEDVPGCTKPTQVPTAAIVAAVVVPIVLITVVLIVLHRRNVKKLRAEDTHDRYKSLDFGVDQVPLGARRKGGKPEMVVTEKHMGGHAKGMSFDMGSPYIMPAGLNASRESFHSMSRSVHDSNDPYRPVTFSKDNGSMRSTSRGRFANDNGSLYTTSSGATDRMNGSLLKNAQQMSQSIPPRRGSLSPDEKDHRISPAPVIVPISPFNPRTDELPSPPPPARIEHKSSSPEPISPYTSFQPSQAPVLPPVVTVEGEEPALQGTKATVTSTPSPPPRVQSQQAVVLENGNTTSMLSTSSYGDAFQITPPSPTEPHEPGFLQEKTFAPEPLRTQPAGLGVDNSGFNTNRLSMSLRPLPPVEDANENPEERANRIRSFYKEYFDDSKPDPAGGHAYGDYMEDYGSEYLDGTVFDPQTGAFIVAQPQAPFAEPVTRRAMTPPPRAPPRFRSGSNPRGSPHGSFMPPRGMSSMSGRLPTHGPRRPPPPPAALASLPTPHKLKDDHMVFNPIDFAPPVSFRERQNGLRPDSPLGSSRPYSPSVRAHTPLVSSFDDLAVMPSPHALRKSGTFTALDFAPPPRFRDPENASDAGSIRSNRSGLSSVSRMAIRTGANRVSRIPKGVVGTKDDIFSALKPKMDMVLSA